MHFTLRLRAWPLHRFAIGTRSQQALPTGDGHHRLRALLSLLTVRQHVPHVPLLICSARVPTVMYEHLRGKQIGR